MHQNPELSNNRRHGFTLLELLVVVAIIGFLSSVSILALSASQQNSRDKQRKLDQLTIVKAAELYTSDFGVPPTQMCVDADNNGACDSVTYAEPERLYSINRENFLNSFAGIETVAAAGPIIEGGGDGGSDPVCGNGVVETGEQCDGSNLNGASCLTLGYTGGTLSCSGGTCQYNTSQCTSAPSNCNGNLICEPQNGENYSVCPSDCSSGGGGTPGTCGNGICNTGETPGNCSQDCTNISMCYVGGQWNLCCAFGTNCTAEGGGTATGYYGVCNADRCEVKYLEQKPTFTCTTSADCIPYPGGQPSGPNDPKAQNLYVPSTAPNWLRGLEPYLAALPRDPGKHNFGTGHDELFDRYYVSSHPEIVGSHVFCAWVSYHRVSDNFNPYNDLNYYPTGTADAQYWTPLCIK